MALGIGKKNTPAKPQAQVTPKSTLLHLKHTQLRPSPNNPRRLFDPGPLQSLRESIEEHGVLVPLTVYKLAGQTKYAIVDGERRFKCCVDLAKKGKEIDIPANVVDPPDVMASLIYMFNIHQFREQWELMPTARALKTVMEELGPTDPEELHQITGLSLPQVERSLRILSFPERFQLLSLKEDPQERIASNFWVELYPVLEKAQEVIPDLVKKKGRDGITDLLVQKYRSGKIKSVIHFRRVLEAFDVAETKEERTEVAQRLREYILDPQLETRQAFDHFIHDTRRFQKASDAADRFMRDVTRAKVDHTLEGKEELVEKLREVVAFVNNLLIRLEGSDPPPDDTEEDR
jgi:ParB family transcriptional regulator, chromosome partitioning protein